MLAISKVSFRQPSFRKKPKLSFLECCLFRDIIKKDCDCFLFDFFFLFVWGKMSFFTCVKLIWCWTSWRGTAWGGEKKGLRLCFIWVFFSFFCTRENVIFHMLCQDNLMLDTLLGGGTAWEKKGLRFLFSKKRGDWVLQSRLLADISFAASSKTQFHY